MAVNTDLQIISVLVPVYNEEANLQTLYHRLDKMVEHLKYAFEFIFIDDCSTDRSFPLLKEIASRDPRIKIIRFSRNFGSHAACMAGLMDSKGDACAFISADMQEPPELINQMVTEWEKGYEIVMGVREGGENRPGLLQKTYYFMARKLALKNMPERGTDVFLIDRKVVDAITHFNEKNTSIVGLLLWSGFNQAFIPYKRELRQKGVSKWTWGKKTKLFIDTFVSFSYFPIRLMSVAGMTVAFIGFLYAAVVIFNRLFFARPIEGWASLMVVFLVVSGIQMLMLGVLGEYLWRSFDESRNRPPFIISEKVGFSEEDEPKSFY
jgi:glycosyltransferase involved in cell wall biosynthesis